MTFVMRINSDNAAFEDGNASTETVRILRELADQIERKPVDWCGDGLYVVLRDINGNGVGLAIGRDE